MKKAKDKPVPHACTVHHESKGIKVCLSDYYNNYNILCIVSCHGVYKISLSR